ncbi:MAG: PQQ-binding-like beta-propeller repeat protein [Planctomycetota bacterium]
MSKAFVWLCGLLLCLVSVAHAASVASTDWPQWRGPNRDDVSTETGLLKQWPAGGPKLLWKAEGVGAGFSSVSIAGDKIFTMGDVEGSSQLLCLNLKDGSNVWKLKVGKPAGGGGYPGTRCTPTVDGALVYAMSQYGDIVCADSTTGKEVWRKEMAKDFGGQMMSGWGYSESPLIDGALFICTPGGPKGALVALNKKTGELAWRSTDVSDHAAYSSPIAVDINGVHQIIQLTDANVFAVAADSGKLLWKAARAGKTAVIPTPVYFDNHVYVASGYGVGCNDFKISFAGGKFSAEQVYANTDMVNHHGGIARIGDFVYGHSDKGGWTCMEMKTGKVKWQNRTVGKGALTIADGMLYLRSEGGGKDNACIIALVEVNPEAYKETGRFEQPNRSGKQSWPHPVVSGGKLYIRDQDVLLCYDIKAK